MANCKTLGFRGLKRTPRFSFTPLSLRYAHPHITKDIQEFAQLGFHSNFFRYTTEKHRISLMLCEMMS